MKQTKQTVQERASVILQVRSGRITAVQGARLLGISRKSYYQWEKRALEAMMAALEEQPAGRPKANADPRKQALQRENVGLKKELEAAQQTAALRAALLPNHLRSRRTASKKNG